MRRWFRSGTESDKIALSSLDLPPEAFERPAKVDRRCQPSIVEPIPTRVRFEMMRFVDQIHQAFRETVRSGSLVGVEDLPSRLRFWGAPAETRDQMWSQVLRDYIEGPRGRGPRSFSRRCAQTS